ncbi:MAG: hypothetical protein Q7O66_23085 [Dehalococcoidia bacterium]|nr:hypothetical protein [Dehalococcoidia bacterium]
MGTAWRYRRCPGCGTVRAAGEFYIVGGYRPSWDTGAILRECPSCGYRATTAAFRVVRERRAA